MMTDSFLNLNDIDNFLDLNDEIDNFLNLNDDIDNF